MYSGTRWGLVHQNFKTPYSLCYRSRTCDGVLGSCTEASLRTGRKNKKSQKKIP